MNYHLECTVTSTKHDREQGLTLNNKDTDEDLTFDDKH